jgi:formate hydrogenlyase subunit 3/multisubunit Na+/H+ antiporter MnhD subunit
MILIIGFVLISLFTIIAIPFTNNKWKAILVFAALSINVILSSYFAIQTLGGQSFEFIFGGSIITGLIPVRIDALSGWFMLVINFIFITGGFYGLFYMNAYREQKNNLTLHSISFILLHAAMTSLCVIQNSIAFLIAWEFMALTAFLLIIFEHEKITTISAGINYLIQSHIAIVFLMIGFMWVAHKTGSYDFNSITTYSSGNGAVAIVLFLCFFVAFAIKAGFVPFHTWLPYAHPAAPAHISGIMSGVIIKIGIFGILRMLLLIKPDFTIIGYIILVISIISGLYGVILAIVQHNLKKLLAYHSVENIGIIGIGIGIGCIGLGTHNQILAISGFTGALLHVFNHALFKSLLFYTSGNIYLSTHTLNIEHLGGLIKKMPQTAFLFLIAAIAICGIPPFNGFISEFIIYNGLYQWMQDALLMSSITVIISILALVAIGGLALLCFTKAFSVVFLGNQRTQIHHEIKEVSFFQLIPLYLIALFIVVIGLFPQYFQKLLAQPTSLFTSVYSTTTIVSQTIFFDMLQSISWAAMGLIIIVGIVFLIRKQVQKRQTITHEPTWGCGYVAPTPKMQYTASSFIRTFTKLFGMMLLFHKKVKHVENIFPKHAHFESHSDNKKKKWLVNYPLMAFKSFLGKFRYLQNGNLQFYLLYGIIFIVLVITVPLIYNKIGELISFLNQL